MDLTYCALPSYIMVTGKIILLLIRSLNNSELLGPIFYRSLSSSINPSDIISLLKYWSLSYNPLDIFLSITNKSSNDDVDHSN
jgi:hypothetical protein